MKLKQFASLSIAAVLALSVTACGSSNAASTTTASSTASVAASEEAAPAESEAATEAETASVAGEYLSVDKVPLDVPTLGELGADVTVTLNDDGTSHVLIFIYDALQGQFDSTYTADGTTVTIPLPELCQGINRDSGEFEDSEDYTGMFKSALGDSMTIELDVENGEFTMAE